MARACYVVDAAGHVLKPLDLWDKYIDPTFRERRLLPYRNVDISKFYPYGDVSFP